MQSAAIPWTVQVLCLFRFSLIPLARLPVHGEIQGTVGVFLSSECRPHHSLTLSVSSHYTLPELCISAPLLPLPNSLLHLGLPPGPRGGSGASLAPVCQSRSQESSAC
jgi:hypothetical protein